MASPLVTLGRLGKYKAKSGTQSQPQSQPAPQTTPTVGEPVNQGTTASTPQEPLKGTATGKVQEGQTDPTAGADKPGMTEPGGPDYTTAITGLDQWKPSGLQGLGYNANDPKLKAFEKELQTLLAAGDIQGAKDRIAKEKGGTFNIGGLYHANLYGQHVLKNIEKLEAEAGGQQGTGNPFADGSVQETFGPKIDAITEQYMTQADQKLESDQEIREHTGKLYDDIGQRTDEAGERIEGVQEGITDSHQQLQQDIQNLQDTLPQMAEEATAKFGPAIEQTMEKVDSAQALIDSKESHALGQVMQGQSAAMQAAVQGIQGQINSQIAQINANPNLTPAQKSQMTAQVRMQGTGAMAPAVGQTILQFNDLYARTATSFGQMTTQLQSQGITAMAQLSGAEAQAFAATTAEANKIAAGLMNTRAQADASYASAMTNLESVRSTIETAGDSLRAQLLPGMGKPYANYHDVMVQDLQMNFDLAKTEFQSMMGQYGMEVYSWMAKQSANAAKNGMWADIAQAFGGGLGKVLGVIGIFGQNNQNNSGGPPPPPGSSGFSF